jgi:prevent-host-death family protein
MAEEGIRALKQNASKVVARAAAGEMVTITDRGRPVALLTPIPAGRLEALIAAGRARPAKRRLADLSAPPDREGRHSVSQTVSAMRDEERS